MYTIWTQSRAQSDLSRSPNYTSNLGSALKTLKVKAGVYPSLTLKSLGFEDAGGDDQRQPSNFRVTAEQVGRGS